MMGRRVVRCSVPIVFLAAAIAALVACAPEPPATDPVARGRQLYRALGCADCHEDRLFGLIRAVGPPLDHAGTVAATRQPGVSAAEYLRRSILDPGAYVVPGYPDSMPRGMASGLSPGDIDALVAYLLSLR